MAKKVPVTGKGPAVYKEPAVSKRTSKGSAARKVPAASKRTNTYKELKADKGTVARIKVPG